MSMLFDVVVFVAGYIASIYTWSKIKISIDAARSGAVWLRQKASQIAARLWSL